MSVYGGGTSYGGSSFYGGAVDVAGIVDVDPLAQDEILIELTQRLKNDEQASLLSNYTITPLGAGQPVEIRDVLLQNGFGSTSVILVVTPFTVGEEYEVEISGNLNWLSRDTLNSALATKVFKGRLTKIDSSVGSRPLNYDTRPTALFRHLLNAIHREDDLIGGTRSDYIGFPPSLT